MILLKIKENDSAQRLDRFLKKIFPKAKNSLIYKLNRKWTVKLKTSLSQDKFIKKDNEYKLQNGDEVKIFLSDKEFRELSEKKETFSDIKIQNKFDKKDIVYEDKDLLVVNKNPWINVHPWDYKTKTLSLITIVQDYLWNKISSLTFKPSLIHRLDRDTSGIVMIWKTKTMLTKLVYDFRRTPEEDKRPNLKWWLNKNLWNKKIEKPLKKTYYAIVLWKMSRKSWTIKKKILRLSDAKNENKVQISEKWLNTITHYKLLQEREVIYLNEKLIISELEINIETGRMHQIRIHMSSIWNSILWDKTYWDKKINAFFEKNYGLRRQALHAWKIEFFHYIKNKPMKLEARIKKDLLDFIEKIKKAY